MSNYPRRPRGGPPDLPEGYEKRFSFCCGRKGCRTRRTPPSVRFFGRRWYLAPVVVLVSALQYGVSRRRLATVRKWLGRQVCKRTVERWRRWWLEVFPASPTWEVKRGSFVPPVDVKRLPQSLLERFQGDGRAQLVLTLRLVSPLTSGSCASSLTGERRR